MITRFYRYITWLSLDVTAGAIVFMSFLSKLFGTQVAWSESAALGISVWLIYTVDHLIDARVANDPISPRRDFHRRNFWLLTGIAGMVLGIGIWVLSILSKILLHYGMIMAVLGVGYMVFTQIKERNGFKELQVALGYACGVFLVPALKLESLALNHILVLITVYFLAFLNLILISRYEKETDETEGFSSMIFFISQSNLKWVLILTLGLLISSGLYFILFTSFYEFGTIAVVGGTINYFLLQFTKIFKQGELYRIVGDAVFILPIIWLV